jgi:hypothetical protein
MSAKTIRRKVQCLLCKDVFDHDYLVRHTSSKHPDLSQQHRLAPTGEPNCVIKKSPWDIPPPKKPRYTTEADAYQSTEVVPLSISTSEEISNGESLTIVMCLYLYIFAI